MLYSSNFCTMHILNKRCYFKESRYLLIFLSLALSGCGFYSAGHGSLSQSYTFNTSKAKLESAVMKVIADTNKYYREPPVSQEYKDLYKKTMEERNKEDKDNYEDPNVPDYDYYNDGTNYVTIKIKDTGCKFTFRYYGDENMWKTSPTSAFFIVYARDKSRKGGGYNDHLDPEFVKQLTKVFELKFANEVEKELGLTYSKVD